MLRGLMKLKIVLSFVLPCTFTIQNMEKCPYCNGSRATFCSHCSGIGFINNPKKITVQIPKNVKEGQKIILYESSGSEVYEIENCVGKNYIEVKTILENNYGLNVVIEKMEPEDDKEYGEQEILKQDLEVGTKVSKGTNITLYIPDVVLEYPDFTDGTWTVDDITKFCKEYEINVTFKKEANSDYNEGEIISATSIGGLMTCQSC